MDYTTRHRNNLTPDASNYQFLHALYGLIPGATPYTAPADQFASAPTQAPVSTSSFGQTTGGSGGFVPPPPRPPQNNQKEEKEKEKEKEKKEKDDRRLEELPGWLLEAIREAREQEFEGEERAIQLPGGYALLIHQYKA